MAGKPDPGKASREGSDPFALVELNESRRSHLARRSARVLVSVSTAPCAIPHGYRAGRRPTPARRSWSRHTSHVCDVWRHIAHVRYRNHGADIRLMGRFSHAKSEACFTFAVVL